MGRLSSHWQVGVVSIASRSNKIRNRKVIMLAGDLIERSWLASRRENVGWFILVLRTALGEFYLFPVLKRRQTERVRRPCLLIVQFTINLRQ